MQKKVAVKYAIVIMLTTCVTSCAGIKRQLAEMEARGTIEGGGYTWKIPAESEGGNSIQTHGFPGKQAATDASTKLCKKYGRIAQYVSHRAILITGTSIFEFNCVR